MSKSGQTVYLSDIVIEEESPWLLHPPGRFVSVPVARRNLESELTTFFLEVLGTERSTPTAAEHQMYRDFARSLVLNVVEHHLNAAYDYGRQAAYAEHHTDTDPQETPHS